METNGEKYTIPEFIEPEVSEARTGAVRSGDVAKERWDLMSYPAAAALLEPLTSFTAFDLEPEELIAAAVEQAGHFIGGDEGGLARGFCYLAVGIQKLDADDKQYQKWVETVLRYQERDHKASTIQYAPYHCFRRMAMTYHEGATKYGMHNWLNGFPITDLVNHFQKHLVKYLNGAFNEEGWIPKTVEDDLGHASWGFVATQHMLMYRPDMCKFRLAPNFTITAELRAAFPFKKREPMKVHNGPITVADQQAAACENQVPFHNYTEPRSLFSPAVRVTLPDAIRKARGGPTPNLGPKAFA